MDYINSITSGIVVFKIGKEYVYVKPPSAQDKAFADFFSQEQYDDALMDGIWTQEDAEKHLISMGNLDENHEQQLETINQAIENMKADYFNHFYDSSTKEYIKRNLEKQQIKHDEIYSKRYFFFDKTCDYLKKYAFASHILQNNAYGMDGSLVSSHRSVQVLYNKYVSEANNIGSKVRDIAKSTEWKNRWYSSKTDTFQNDLSSLTDLQLSVISWSIYYDGVYQSLDRPSENIIEDDIAIDGWSIIEKRKRKEEEKKRSAEKLLPDKMSNAGEVFIPARNKQRASDIMSLNSIGSMDKIKSLKSDLKTNAVIDEADLTSTRRELQMEAIRMQKENRRR